MSTLNIPGITTMADLKAQSRQPAPQADLDRNAFLRLFRSRFFKTGKPARRAN